MFPSFVHKITYNDPDALQRYVTGGETVDLRRELGAEGNRTREAIANIGAGSRVDVAEIAAKVREKLAEEGNKTREKIEGKKIGFKEKELTSEEERSKLKTRSDSLDKSIESLQKQIKDKGIIRYVGSEEEKARAVREIAELESQMKDLETQKVNLLKGSSPASSTDNDPLGLFK